jgi:hypothetical protein
MIFENTSHFPRQLLTALYRARPRFAKTLPQFAFHALLFEDLALTNLR